MALLGEFTVKDATTVRDDILRTIKNGLLRRGVTSPNVSPDGDWWVLATAVGNELAVVGANCIIKADDQMPDTAVGDSLLRQGEIVSKSKQAAAGSVGSVIIATSAISPIPTGAQLRDASGILYEVTIGGSYDDGDSVPIQAIGVGSATNLEEGTILKWGSAPPFCSDQVEIDVGGLINGIDDETDETYRARILATYQVPPGSGDWEQVAELAEASTARVQKAFVYPAVQGPATTDVAVTAEPTSTSKEREVSSAILTGTVAPYINGKLATPANLTTTTVTDVDADVAFALTIPDAPTANPAGPGGGWTNGTPWPSPDGSSTFRCTVTAVTSTTNITVDATTPPLVNVTRIAWLSTTTWKVLTALVTAFSGTSGAYVITLDRPFVGITTGCYIWPECLNGQAYADTALAAFALMGPGEKTSNASALTRGFRHPPPSVSWPYSLGSHLERALTSNNDEVDAAAFYHRTDATTTVTGSGGSVVPQVPTALTDAPLQFVPRHIAFYRIA